jgi:hypothetical protein
MELIAQKTMNDLNGFDKMLDDTEHMNGLTLKIYSTFIQDYVTVWADQVSWDGVTERLNNPESGLYKQVQKLIDLVEDAAKADGYATCLEVLPCDRFDYIANALEQLDF